MSFLGVRMWDMKSGLQQLGCVVVQGLFSQWPIELAGEAEKAVEFAVDGQKINLGEVAQAPAFCNVFVKQVL